MPLGVPGSHCNQRLLCPPAGLDHTLGKHHIQNGIPAIWALLAAASWAQASARGVLGQALVRTTASSSDWARGWGPEGPVCTAP